MPWIILTKDHVKARLAEDELNEIEGVGGGDGDRLVGIIDQVTALVRAKVVSCHKNELGPDGTIPKECLYAAATLAKHALRGSLPSTGGEDETEIRKTEYRDANDFLRDVASCKISIASDAGPIGGRDTGCFGGDPKHDF